LPAITPHPSLLILAGDVSGDAHCARLARELLRRHPDWTIHALGGPQLQAAGAQMLGDTSRLGVIGFASALAILPRVLQLRHRVLRLLDVEKIQAVVLCDWGGFNTRLLHELQKRKLPVLYYFPPRSWQKSGAGGLAIAPLVTRVATPFPWSAQRLQEAGCRAEWVGHPVLEEIGETPPRTWLRRGLNVADDEKLIALLPGSRDLELKYIAPPLAGAMRLLQESPPDGPKLRFVVAAAPGREKALQAVFPQTAIVEDKTLEVLRGCNAAVVKSGTSTLQAAACDAPQVVVYDIPPLLRAQWKLTGMAKKTPFVAMPNIILDREVVPERLGDDCRPDIIAGDIRTLLQDETRRRMQADYQAVRQALGAELPFGATARTAEMVEEMLSLNSPAQSQ
jgi:lipid-A-disaccharide synthase